jgi:hypothetical protein
MKNLELDMTMSMHGFEKMDDEDAKKYMQKRYVAQKTKGYLSAAKGIAAIPEGATYKEGVIYDNAGKQIGEYEKGYEPKSAQELKPNSDVLEVGGSFYKYNPQLAKRLGRPSIENDSDWQDTSTQLQQMYQGLQGKWLPSTRRVGAETFRYYPSIAEQYPQPGSQTTTQPVDGRMRNAVIKAISQKLPKEQILQGIVEEGYNPEDFEDLLSTYEPSVSALRQHYLGGMLKQSGMNGTSLTDTMKVLSNEVNKRKTK